MTDIKTCTAIRMVYMSSSDNYHTYSKKPATGSHLAPMLPSTEHMIDALPLLYITINCCLLVGLPFATK